MDNRSLKDKILYNKYSWLIPGQPLIAWADTVNDLNKFYNRPEINLTDSKEDLVKKNDMRHIVGLARINQSYFNPLAVLLGGVKEGLDYAKDFVKPNSLGYVTGKTKEDTKIDWGNNFKGINYTDRYPQASCEDIIQYAWGLAKGAKPIEEQPKSKLYKMLVDNIETKEHDNKNSLQQALYGKISN